MRVAIMLAISLRGDAILMTVTIKHFMSHYKPDVKLVNTPQDVDISPKHLQSIM